MFTILICILKKGAATMKKIFSLVMALVLSISVSSTVFAGKSRRSRNKCKNENVLKLARKYYEGLGCERDAKRAFDLYKIMAQRGHVSSIVKLGCMYFDGDGVECDYAKALECFTRKEVLDDVEAQGLAGFIYDKGLAGPPDYVKAMEYYTKSAENGWDFAQFYLGALYEKLCNYERACFWYEEARKQNYAFAKNSLALLLLNGYGVKQDIKAGYELLKEAVDQGCSMAMCNVAAIHYLGVYGMPKDISLVIQMYRNAINAGCSIAKYRLAELYKEGKCVPRDMDLATELYEQSANEGFDKAQVAFGDILMNKMEFEKAIYWYDLAYSQGCVLAKVRIARAFETGVVLEKDTGKALELYKEAVGQGDSEAMFYFALIKLEGLYGESKNIPFAMDLLKKSSYLGFANAQFVLAKIYENGLYGEKKLEDRAINLYNKAAENECALAMLRLGQIYNHPRCPGLAHSGKNPLSL